MTFNQITIHTKSTISFHINLYSSPYIPKKQNITTQPFKQYISQKKQLKIKYQ